jgi:hypothetical protein
MLPGPFFFLGVGQSLEMCRGSSQLKEVLVSLGVIGTRFGGLGSLKVQNIQGTHSGVLELFCSLVVISALDDSLI